jgi:preprotein translocase subunit SecE
LTWSRNRKYRAKGSTSKILDNIKWFAALAVFSAAVIGNSYFVEVAFLYRVLGVVFLFIVGLGILAVTNFGSNAIKNRNKKSRLANSY